MNIIDYSIISFDPYLHRIEMRLTFSPTSSRSVIGLPNWIPGSYKIRDFAKNVITVSAIADGKEVDCVALDKHRWVIHAECKKIIVTYSVYAKDISVRTAYCDDQLFFFNSSSLCMYIEGQETSPCTLTISPSKHKTCKDWRCDTALDAKKKDAKGFGTFMADDYDTLIDYPFMVGPLQTISFKAHGIPHRMSMVGASRVDLGLLTHDLKKICEAQISFFGKSLSKKRMYF